jgi:hypothetical protein
MNESLTQLYSSFVLATLALLVLAVLTGAR